MTPGERRASLAAVLGVCRDASLPDEVALMRLIMATENIADLERQLTLAARALDRKTASRLRRLVDRARLRPDTWPTVHGAAAAVPHGPFPGRPAEIVADFASSFDAAAKLSPEASVALYSLGDADSLAAATAEIAVWLREAGLLGPECEILDVGCGIGRLEAALGAKVGRIIGTDISEEMIKIARQRCETLHNVEFRLTSGLGLADFAGASFDCVVAVDTFPYLVAAGGDLAEWHIHEAARVLKPAGELVILNYSYRGAPVQDREDVERIAEATGLRTILAGTRPFGRWDGAAFRMIKPHL
jgi:SAM-dependent methyltransferase